ncbi:hypothetical protein PIB30_017643 [Stylosanthes scabra]|uniref:DUF4283 domain-containing protein n=1 Tax=Stylosanthes scabra TaxID=79078 RepID=A0ABU6X5X9_9FABA|nr:hypothetical protein [Stylosanthes scabra]
MQDLLNRSILAEKLKPIKFGIIVQSFGLMSERLGRIEYRDLGSTKCILSFESKDMRDKALDDTALTIQFDDLRPYWGYKWSHYRRVWVELMGVPIHTWSKDTFSRIAKTIDGKLVMQHELTEETACLSVARILFETCRWEPIQEWLFVKCEDVGFEVYAKEFGFEVLSFQVYPEEMEETPVEDVDEEVNVEKIPNIVKIINDKLGDVHKPMRDTDNIGDIETHETRSNDLIKEEITSQMGWNQGSEWAQNGYNVNEEAQLNQESMLKHIEKEKVNNGPDQEDISSSSNTCPFPPDLGRAQMEYVFIHQLGRTEFEAARVRYSNPNSEDEDSESPDDKEILLSSQVPETTEALLEVAKTRRVCEKGGIFLHDGYDNVLLRDLIECNDVDKGLLGGKQKNIKSGGRGCGKKQVMLASAKRIIQSGVKLNSK